MSPRRSASCFRWQVPTLPHSTCAPRRRQRPFRQDRRRGKPMTSRSWEALVVEGKRLGLADPLDRWAIGDLAIEAIPPGQGRAERSAVQETLKEFSAATGIPLGVLKDCHRTSEAWPLGMRIADISHAQHSRYA